MIKYPADFIPALRSDHAGETGAVAIYRTVIRFSRDMQLKAFAKKHLGSEINHLESLKTLLPREKRSRLLFFWKAGGFFTAAAALLFGSRQIYGVLASVEDGVVKHYDAQLKKLAGRAEYQDLYALLEQFRQDEVIHRDEARALCGGPGLLPRIWCRIIQAGSAAAAALSSRI